MLNRTTLRIRSLRLTATVLSLGAVATERQPVRRHRKRPNPPRH